MRFTVVYAPSDEGGFTVHVPALPGCVSEGESLDEARQNIREAVAVYFEPDEQPPSDGVVVENLEI